MSGATAPPRTAAVVVAAGKGLRAGQPVPKQFANWRGKPLVRHSAEALAAAGTAPIVVVIPDDARDLAEACLVGIPSLVLVGGARTRQGSVRLGLEALAEHGPDRVLIHDAARPGLTAPVIERLLSALDMHAAAIPVLPVVDSLLRADGGVMAQAQERETMRRVQTPQAFRYRDILAAHRDWRGSPDAGDDAQVARAAGIEVALVEGDEALGKLTFAADFESSAPSLRVGTGYDVHRLEAGRELWLCGVKIEHGRGLAGHSDADVAIHALVDAMLGAIGAGDIGEHFPASEPQWRDAPSGLFLARAAALVAAAGYRLGNADLTIVCEAPRIGPHREAMRAKLASILGVDIGAVSVKATTTEKLGFTGRSEGIAAQAVVGLVRL